MHLQICIFRPQGELKSKKISKETHLKIQFYIENMWASSSKQFLKSHWALVPAPLAEKIRQAVFDGAPNNFNLSQFWEQFSFRFILISHKCSKEKRFFEYLYVQYFLKLI